MKQKRFIRKETLPVLAVCVLLALSGCGSPSENTANGGRGDAAAAADSAQSGNAGETVNAAPPEEKLCAIGETVIGIDPSVKGEGREENAYTVTSATLYDEFASSGLAPDKTCRGELYALHPEELPDYNPDDYGPQMYEAADYPIVACSVRIENKNCPQADDMSANELALVYFDPDTGAVTQVSTPCYFADAAEKNADNGRFFHYELAQGEAFETTIAYGVDLSQYDPANLYLCINYYCKEEFWKLVDLHL